MKNTPSRAEWYGQPSGGVMIETHDAFGWKVHRHLMPVGSRLIIVSMQPVARADSPNRAMFTKGRATVTGEDGTKYPDRVPGLWTHERPEQPAGTTTIEAVEDLEFWCFNYTANRNALPKLRPVRVASGKRLNIEAGTLVFLASGSTRNVEAPCSITTERRTRLTARTPLYGFVVKEAKP